MQTAQNRGWIVFAGLSGGLSVAAGAFAAHGLNADTEALEIGWLHTGSLYEAQHALAMLAVSCLAGFGLVAAKPALIAQYCFLTGSILFPAALYGLALHGPRWLGAVAPVGGLGFIFGWVALAAAAYASHDSERIILKGDRYDGSG